MGLIYTLFWVGPSLLIVLTRSRIGVTVLLRTSCRVARLQEVMLVLSSLLVLRTQTPYVLHVLVQ